MSENEHEPVLVRNMAEFERIFGPAPPLRIPLLEVPDRESWWRRLLNWLRWR